MTNDEHEQSRQHARADAHNLVVLIALPFVLSAVFTPIILVAAIVKSLLLGQITNWGEIVLALSGLGEFAAFLFSLLFVATFLGEGLWFWLCRPR